MNFIHLEVPIRAPSKKRKYVILDDSASESEDDNNISPKPKEKRKRVQKISDSNDDNSEDEVVIVNEVEGRFSGKVKMFDKKAFTQLANAFLMSTAKTI